MSLEENYFCRNKQKREAFFFFARMASGGNNLRIIESQTIDKRGGGGRGRYKDVMQPTRTPFLAIRGLNCIDM